MKTVLIISLIFLTILFQLEAKKKAKNIRIQSTFEMRVDSVLKLMTLDEKVGQLSLLTGRDAITGPGGVKKNFEEDIRKGKVGNLLNAIGASNNRKLQEIAVKESRLRIPLLFGYDVIHGYKTMFPLSLGEAASWDMDMIEKAAHVMSVEAAVSGINWTFAPMVDIGVDPRWGRVSEGGGEDPFLGSRIAEARVRGIQGKDNNLAAPFALAACVKHFAAYGAPIAGREYNTVDMSERRFRDIYLPPYKAAINAGAVTIMTAFNELNGVPATADKWLMRDILRKEIGFKGFVVTDYNSMNELVLHGVATDEEHAGKLAIEAGIDMDMQGNIYVQYLKKMVEKGQVSIRLIDQAVKSILTVKFRLGLFDNPYKNCNTENEKKYVYTTEHLQAAYDMAVRSMVLLKNQGNTLPLKKGEKIAVIGKLATAKRELVGSWKAAAEWEHLNTFLDEIRLLNGDHNIVYAEGAELKGTNQSGFDDAIVKAAVADKIVFVMGSSDLGGECSSLTDLRLPWMQTELLKKLKTLNKPIVIVLMNARPLDLSVEDGIADAILETWFAGSTAGKAITDVLFGKYNPSGKLPMTFPRNVGQIPIFYNEKSTGRPGHLTEMRLRSMYNDCSNSPLYPFGYGLSYTNFSYSEPRLSENVMKKNKSIEVSVDITNDGKWDGEEVVQLYIQDLVGSVSRPVKELKGFKKIMIKKGETKAIKFSITDDMLAFHRLDMTYGSEPGYFKVLVGGNSIDLKELGFMLE